MMNLNYHIILASKSPRRKKLLEEMGFGVTVQSQYVDEQIPEGMDSYLVAEHLAVKKGDNYSKEIPENHILLTADTVVLSESGILGKPSDRDEAIEMLKELRDKEHKVITGVSLRDNHKGKSFSDATVVKFKRLSLSEIEYYVDNFKPFDKAGGYGIQEWIGHIGVEYIKGSFHNVVGLPSYRVYDALMNFSL